MLSAERLVGILLLIGPEVAVFLTRALATSLVSLDAL